MREIRPSGSEGGATELNRSSLPLSPHIISYPAECYRYGPNGPNDLGGGGPAGKDVGGKVVGGSGDIAGRVAGSGMA